MLKRRVILASVALGWLNSGCAVSGRGVTFDTVLAHVPGLSTGRDVISRLGPPSFAFEFNGGDRNSPFLMQWMSISWLRRRYMQNPPSLLDTLPIGARMMVYNFEDSPMLGGAELIVCVDANDRIVGWLYSDISIAPDAGGSSLRLPEGAIGFERAMDVPGRSVTMRTVLVHFPGLSTRRELISRLGPPAIEFEFRGGDHDSPIILQTKSRSALRGVYREHPSGLLDTLPIGSRMMRYNFEHRLSSGGTGLIVCVDVNERIVGWLTAITVIALGGSALRLPEGAIGFE